MPLIDRLFPALGTSFPWHDEVANSLYEGYSSVHDSPCRAEIAQNKILSSSYCQCQTFFLEIGNIPLRTLWHRRFPGCLLFWPHGRWHIGSHYLCSLWSPSSLIASDTSVGYYLPVTWSSEGGNCQYSRRSDRPGHLLQDTASSVIRQLHAPFHGLCANVPPTIDSPSLSVLYGYFEFYYYVNII